MSVPHDLYLCQAHHMGFNLVAIRMQVQQTREAERMRGIDYLLQARRNSVMPSPSRGPEHMSGLRLLPIVTPSKKQVVFERADEFLMWISEGVIEVLACNREQVKLIVLLLEGSRLCLIALTVTEEHHLERRAGPSQEGWGQHLARRKEYIDVP